MKDNQDIPSHDLKYKNSCDKTSESCQGTPHKKTKKKSKRTKRQAAEIGDESPLPYEVKSSALPLKADRKTINTRYMPTLGNGYIGTTVYSDTMYLNGVFNGEGANSHKAAIPALLMSRINLSNPEIENRSTRKYIYNALEGYFMETIKSEYALIEHKVYMHQKYIRLYVVEINVKLQPANYGGGVLTLSYPPAISEDINFRKPVTHIGNWLLTGSTKVPERPGGDTRQVYIYYQEPLRQITISGSQRKSNYTFLMAVDTNEANARNEFDTGSRELLSGKDSNWRFFQKHVAAWRETWENGRIELSGSNTNQLIKAVWFAQSYILNSLPAENPSLPPPYQEIFYGVSRNSIGKGDKGKDYQGHVMWDNEHYILPAILPFHPYLAKQMLRYRSALGESAAQNAALNNAPGWHFPWESAYTGAEVTPEPCPGNDTLCHWRRLYTTTGVALAIRQYTSMTLDRDFWINPIYQGCVLSKKIATFLASQLTYNPEIKRYELLDATGPDTNHPRVDNNAFLLTNINHAIQFARYLSCLCQNNEREEVPDETVKKSFYLNLQYDIIKRLHYQFEGFDAEKDRSLKIPDTIMMNHPLSWNYSMDILRNDLNYYKLLIEKKPSAMVLPWFVIGWKFTNEVQEMTTMFQKSFRDYMIQPFKIWTEYTETSEADQEVGSTNFLPGMGGFLQSLIYGFAGVKIRPDRLEFYRPIPPPMHLKMILRNFHYLNNNLTFTIEPTKITIELLAVESQFPLTLKINNTEKTEILLTKGIKPIVIEPSEVGFFIYTTSLESCEQPRDYIYMPFGYFDWVDNSSPSIAFAYLSCVLTTIWAASFLILTH